MTTTGPLAPVSNVVQREPVLIDGMSSVQEALQLMHNLQISALVVKRRDARDEFGLLLLTEIARLVLSNNRSLDRTSVYEIMIKPAPSIEADMAIKYAVRHMTRNNLTHSIVLHARDLAGVVTLNEMAMVYAEF